MAPRRRELFYTSADQKMMAVTIKAAAAGIEAGTRQALFDGAPELVSETYVYQPMASAFW